MLWLHAYLLLSPFAPPPCHPRDVDRFPPCIHEVISREEEQYWPDVRCPIVESRLDWLRANQAMHFHEIGEWNDWDEQIEEQVHLGGTWAYLFRARWLANHDGDPSFYLEELRRRLGEEAYAAGRMPPPIPRARYSEITR